MSNVTTIPERKETKVPRLSIEAKGQDSVGLLHTGSSTSDSPATRNVVNLMEFNGFIKNFIEKQLNTKQINQYLNKIFSECDEKSRLSIFEVSLRQLSNEEVKTLHTKIQAYNEQIKSINIKMNHFNALKEFVNENFANELDIRKTLSNYRKISSDPSFTSIANSNVINANKEEALKKKFNQSISSQVSPLKLDEIEKIKEGEEEIAHLSDRDKNITGEKRKKRIKRHSQPARPRKEVELKQPVTTSRSRAMSNPEIPLSPRISDSDIEKAIKKEKEEKLTIKTTEEIKKEEEIRLSKAFAHSLGLSNLALKSHSKFMIPSKEDDLYMSNITSNIINEFIVVDSKIDEFLNTNLLSKGKLNISHLLKAFYALVKVHDPNLINSIIANVISKTTYDKLEIVYKKLLEDDDFINLRQTIESLAKGEDEKSPPWKKILEFINKFESNCLLVFTQNKYPVPIVEKKVMLVNDVKGVREENKNALLEFLPWKLKYDKGFAEEVRKYRLKAEIKAKK